MATIQKRLTESGKPTYRCMIRRKGLPALSASFPRHSLAKQWVQKMESEYLLNRHGLTPRCKTPMAEIIDRYLSELRELSIQKYEDRHRQLDWWKQRIGSVQLANVTPQAISRFKALLVSEPNRHGLKRSGTTVNRYLAALSHVFTVCITEWHILDGNPVSKIKKMPVNRGRSRFLSDDERERLLVECGNSENRHLLTIVILALATGMRQGEILQLRRDSVDLGSAAIILQKTKNGEPRRIPLSPVVLELLRRIYLNTKPGELLFHSANATDKAMYFRRAFNNAVKRAGIADFKFHDLRHCAASYLAMNGATPSEIAEVLGHKSLQMVKRYAHLSHSHVAKVVERMNDKIFSGEGRKDPEAGRISEVMSEGSSLEAMSFKSTY